MRQVFQAVELKPSCSLHWFILLFIPSACSLYDLSSAPALQTKWKLVENQDALGVECRRTISAMRGIGGNVPPTSFPLICFWTGLSRSATYPFFKSLILLWRKRGLSRIKSFAARQQVSSFTYESQLADRRQSCSSRGSRCTAGGQVAW